MDDTAQAKEAQVSNEALAQVERLAREAERYRVENEQLKAKVAKLEAQLETK